MVVLSILRNIAGSVWHMEMRMRSSFLWDVQLMAIWADFQELYDDCGGL
jgi:hypothetical protein